MLEFNGLNYWAVAVAWLINVGVGAFWYSPLGFGKLWSQLSGVDMMKLPKEVTNKAIAFVGVGAVVQVVALAVVLNSLNVIDVIEGLKVGLLLWAGFTAATTIGNTLYSRLSWKFWWLNASFFLLVMAVNAVVLTAWK